jgi:hypothetical protein
VAKPAQGPLSAVPAVETTVQTLTGRRV